MQVPVQEVQNVVLVITLIHVAGQLHRLLVQPQLLLQVVEVVVVELIPSV